MLTDRPVPSGTTLRVFSHLLGESNVMLFGSPALAVRYRDNFPASLKGAPLLLSTRNNAIRGRIDHWFEMHDVRPDIVGEFDDNALLSTFGQSGIGLFPAPSALAKAVPLLLVPLRSLRSPLPKAISSSSARAGLHPDRHLWFLVLRIRHPGPGDPA